MAAQKPSPAPRGRRDQETRSAERRRLLLAALLTGTVLVVELAGGLLSGSLALLSDAAHMFTDLSALLLAFLALTFSVMPGGRRRTYGWYRLEILSALLNAVLLIGIAGFIFYEAYGRLLAPTEIRSGVVLMVATIGLAVNLLSYSIVSRSKESINLRGAAMHVLSDALTSVGVIVSALVVRFTGWNAADPLMSAIIGVVILFGAFQLLRESVDILLEATPLHIDPVEIRETLRKIPGVHAVHDLHVWSITSGMPALSVHLIVHDEWFKDAGGKLVEAKEILKERFDIDHTTIQVESETYAHRATVQWKS
ncbi:MAG: cation diffusion facilitator family transporter [Deltaproteobacteria bacterium]|nr:cation diffusion facilitator family transporter [Deltaproteobacteria bacterium]